MWLVLHHRDSGCTAYHAGGSLQYLVLIFELKVDVLSANVRAMNTIKKRIISVLLLASFFLPVVSFAAEEGWQTFKLINGFIVIDVEIDGRPAKAVLDSGASMNLINTDFIKDHGEDFIQSGRVRMQGVFGEETVDVYTKIPLKLFGTDIELNDAAVGNLGDADLLIGGGLFNNIIVQIDYPKSRMRLLSKKAVNLKEVANVPMERARGSAFPAVQVEANGKKVWLVLDTGNTGGILVKRSFAVENGWLHDETEKSQGDLRGITGGGDTETFQLDALKVGPYTLDNVMVHVPGADQNTNLKFDELNEHQTRSRIKKGVSSKGLLGYEILKHFIVTIDYESFRVNFYAP